MPGRILLFVVLVSVLGLNLAAQAAADQEPSEPPAGVSSSKDTQIDLSPPPGDDILHPDSVSPSDDVSEMQPWDPHKAMKHVEVGDFYFKRGNYRAAESRYREALKWKSNDAVATYKLAETLEKMQDWDESRKFYESYLKILPNGELAQQSKDAIERVAKRGKNEAKK